MTETAPPDLSVERIEELQAQCRNAFDLPQIRLSELSALLSIAHSAASGSERADFSPILHDDAEDGALSVERAYGLLWTVHSDDRRIHEARRLLLEAIGGQGSQRQRDGINYWRAPFLPTKKEPEK